MLKYVPWNWLVCIEPRFLKLIPDDLKTQEMCNKAVEKAPWLLYDVPVCFKNVGIYSRAVEKCLHSLRFIPDHLKTQNVEKNPYQLGEFPDCFKIKRMCEKAVEDEPETLEYVPDYLKTEEICKEAVRREPYALGHVPDHLKTGNV